MVFWRLWGYLILCSSMGVMARPTAGSLALLCDVARNVPKGKGGVGWMLRDNASALILAGWEGDDRCY